MSFGNELAPLRASAGNGWTGVKQTDISAPLYREVAVVVNLASRRVDKALGFVLRLFGHQLERQDFKNLRVVCRAGRDVMDILTEISSISRFWENSIVTIFLNNLINGGETNPHMLEFVSRHIKKRELCLYMEEQLEAFRDFLIAKGIGKGGFPERIQAIESIEVIGLHSDSAKNCFKAVLREMGNHEDVFINLKQLRVVGFYDFTDCTMPKSIEVFKSTFADSNVNICNCENLKSIILECVSSGSFVMRNLPKLESLIIDTLWTSIILDLKGLPSLRKIIVNGERVSFDRSVSETVAIPGYEVKRVIYPRAAL